MTEDRPPKSADEAKELALLRLSVREYSAAEMRQYLKRKCVPGEVAESTVADLLAEKLIDDRRYARVIARHQSFRDKGPMYVVSKLRSKGVRIDLKEVRAMVEDVSQRDETEAVRAVIQRRYSNLSSSDSPKEIRRVFQALLRRGFSSDAVRKCITEITKANPED